MCDIVLIDFGAQHRIEILESLGLTMKHFKYIILAILFREAFSERTKIIRRNFHAYNYF
jgi:hypothetical protein